MISLTAIINTNYGGQEMIPRLVTIFVLIVAVIGVSWGVRVRAQSDTLETRVTTLEA
jgi:uncharacterized membrane protein